MDVAEPYVPYGGVDLVGSLRSFYVSVNGQIDPGGVGSLELDSVTSEATLES